MNIIDTFITNNGLLLLFTAGPFVLTFLLLYIMSFSKKGIVQEEYRSMAYGFLLIAILMVAGLVIFEYVIRHHLTKK